MLRVKLMFTVVYFCRSVGPAYDTSKVWTASFCMRMQQGILPVHFHTTLGIGRDGTPHQFQSISCTKMLQRTPTGKPCPCDRHVAANCVHVLPNVSQLGFHAVTDDQERPCGGRIANATRSPHRYVCRFLGMLPNMRRSQWQLKANGNPLCAPLGILHDWRPRTLHSWQSVSGSILPAWRAVPHTSSWSTPR